jgi:VWFA-related protein
MDRKFATQSEGKKMKAFVSGIIVMVTAGLLILPIAEHRALAQAPTGPQGGQPQQGAPPAPPPPPPAQQKKPADSGVTIAVDVPVVSLEVVATTQHGDILTGLKKENFRITEEGVPQTITSFGPSDAPITIVMLLEFSSRGYAEYFGYQAKYWADAFFPNLTAKDWVALETFDMKTHLEVDFTQNKDEVRAAINHLYFPGFSESNVFDALLETTDRLKDVKGKKSILVIASGVDTFSKHTLDQTMKELRQSDATIFAVGLDKPYTNWLDLHGSRGSHLGFLQAENQLKTFAQETGGNAWFPQFDGEIPGIFQQVAAFLRHQYSITYTPTSGARDGKYHKIKVELVAPDGGPLTVLDQKGKKQKYQVYAREGYTAVKGGIGD